MVCVNIDFYLPSSFLEVALALSAFIATLIFTQRKLKLLLYKSLLIREENLVGKFYQDISSTVSWSLAVGGTHGVSIYQIIDVFVINRSLELIMVRHITKEEGFYSHSYKLYILCKLFFRTFKYMLTCWLVWFKISWCFKVFASVH